ncbi:helix-turn-helix domain-containing protein [Chitinophaga lutea]|uniref:Helix-turn-helix domain-containing protein n=1 Tax=Chitinophaga lutea TaxID=2488634 RepID=A0A3N4PWC3_9BACT|nr:DUF6597 domain-containing transcriptional factor [Chitinophaga lutea]RPE12178.1 helix-turn-helix domain-containing protein [Chitinophaga lutea]
MKYREITPANRLQQYVKCYYIYESDTSTAFEDIVFPSGAMEIIFNLGAGHWQTDAGSGFVTTPAIELWGQIIRPLPVKSIGKNTMLGIRFFPHAASFILNDKASLFNNQVADFSDIWGEVTTSLHGRLLDTAIWQERIALVENFLLQRLAASEGRWNKAGLIDHIMREMGHEDFFDNIENVASRYGITSRYLQKLFLQYTGLTPKLYTKINRFQQSLKLVTQKDIPLTSIAYHCGYFDQSHFIKEFKSFTGLTPSGYAADTSPITVAAVQN